MARPVRNPAPQSTTPASIESDIPRTGVALAIGVVATATLLVYLNSFQGVFLLDDIQHIVENSRIRTLWPISQHLLTRRPVVSLSLALNFAWNGMDVWGYHAFNVAVHVLAAVTLFGVVRRTLLQRALRAEYGKAAVWIAGTATVMWAVHPLLTQSVTYLVQRGESMMGMFYLLTLYTLIRGTSARRSWPWYVACIVSCALGMGSKAVMVTAPLVMLLYDRVFLAGSFRDALRRRYGLYVGLAATWGVLAACGVLRGVLGASSNGIATVGFSVEPFTPLAYALSQPSVIRHYLSLSFWPHSLCLDYSLPLVHNLGSFLPSLLGIAALLAGTAWAIFRWPALGFLGAWFFIILAPTSSIVPITDLAFEHRMYLPLAAVVLLVVIAGYRFLKSLCHRPAPVPQVSRLIVCGLAILVVVSLGYATIRRNRDYLSATGMWRDVIEKRPRNPRAHSTLAGILIQQGRWAEAASHSRTAVRLKPDYAKAHNHLAAALNGLQRREEALDHYREALRLSPNMTAAHVNMIEPLMALGRIDEAIEHGREAVRISPSLATACWNLGLALWRSGRSDEAAEQFRQASRLRPDMWQASFSIGMLSAAQGKHAQAAVAYRNVLRVNPSNADAHFRLGLALAELGQTEQAVLQCKEALRIDPKHEGARQALEAESRQRATPRPRPSTDENGAHTRHGSRRESGETE
ncbi:MAG: tetratricopeptide repeat protein [Planctomycetota bacterium]